MYLTMLFCRIRKLYFELVFRYDISMFFHKTSLMIYFSLQMDTPGIRDFPDDFCGFRFINCARNLWQPLSSWAAAITREKSDFSRAIQLRCRRGVFDTSSNNIFFIKPISTRCLYTMDGPLHFSINYRIAGIVFVIANAKGNLNPVLCVSYRCVFPYFCDLHALINTYRVDYVSFRYYDRVETAATLHFLKGVRF